MDETQRLAIRDEFARRKARGNLLFFLAGLAAVWAVAAVTGWRLPIAMFVPYLLAGAIANWLPWVFGSMGYRPLGWVLPSVWSAVAFFLTLVVGGSVFFVSAGFGNGTFALLLLILSIRERSKRSRS